MRSSIATLLLLVGTLTACAGDPDLTASAASLEVPEVEVGPAIERARWSAAVAGCEGAGPSALHAAATEPLLGVLVDSHGAVVCVDAMALLRQERSTRAHVPSSHPDPTPTPVVLGPHEDPTPTPTLGSPVPRL